MNKRYLRSGFGRFLGLLLCLSLTLPNPAWALREEQTETESGLEEIKLALLDQRGPVLGLKDRIVNVLGLSTPVAPRVLSTAGLEETRQRIDAIKENLSALFASRPQDSGEWRDRERAVARLERLGRILDKLSKNYPKLLGQYEKEIVRPLLEYGEDGQMLNFALVQHEMDAVLLNLDASLNVNASEDIVSHWIAHILEALPKLERLQGFRYLSILPIVLEIPTSDQGSDPVVATVEEATRRLMKSDWREIQPDSLTRVESIFFYEDDHETVGYTRNFSGNHMGLSLLPMHPVYVAGVLVHEDEQLGIYRNPRFRRSKRAELRGRLSSAFIGNTLPTVKEIKRALDQSRVPGVEHPWIKNIKSLAAPFAGLLLELQAHEAGIAAEQHLINQKLVEKEAAASILSQITLEIWQGEDALLILEKARETGRLPKESEEWLNELWGRWGPWITGNALGEIFSGMDSPAGLEESLDDQIAQAQVELGVAQTALDNARKAGASIDILSPLEIQRISTNGKLEELLSRRKMQERQVTNTAGLEEKRSETVTPEGYVQEKSVGAFYGTTTPLGLGHVSSLTSVAKHLRQHLSKTPSAEFNAIGFLEPQAPEGALGMTWWHREDGEGLTAGVISPAAKFLKSLHGDKQVISWQVDQWEYSSRDRTGNMIVIYPKDFDYTAGLEEPRYVSDDPQRARELRAAYRSGKMRAEEILTELLEPFQPSRIPDPAPGLLQPGAAFHVSPVSIRELAEEEYPIRAVAEKLIQSSTHDSARQALARALIEAFAAKVPGETPFNQVAAIYYEMIRFATEERDPLKEFKQTSNLTALDLLPGVEAQVKASPDPLLAALQLGVVGNILDFGSFPHQDHEESMRLIRETIQEVLAKGLAWFSRQDYATLLGRLEKSGQKILFLADNAGEVVFDLPLIKRLLLRRHWITLVGHGRPAANDVTREDLEALLNSKEVTKFFQGIPDWRQRLQVISSGSDVAGVDLRWATPEFVEAWLKADLRIAKGQGNYETLAFNPLTRDLFFLVKIKEPRLILSQFPRGANVLLYQPAAGLEERDAPTNEESPHVLFQRFKQHLDELFPSWDEMDNTYATVRLPIIQNFELPDGSRAHLAYVTADRDEPGNVTGILFREGYDHLHVQFALFLKGREVETLQHLIPYDEDWRQTLLEFAGWIIRSETQESQGLSPIELLMNKSVIRQAWQERLGIPSGDPAAGLEEDRWPVDEGLGSLGNGEAIHLRGEMWTGPDFKDDPPAASLLGNIYAGRDAVSQRRIGSVSAVFADGRLEVESLHLVDAVKEIGRRVLTKLIREAGERGLRTFLAMVDSPDELEIYRNFDLLRDVTVISDGKTSPLEQFYQEHIAGREGAYKNVNWVVGGILSAAGLEEEVPKPPPGFLAYERSLAEKINRKKLFLVELDENGRIKKLNFPRAKQLQSRVSEDRRSLLKTMQWGVQLMIKWSGGGLLLAYGPRSIVILLPNGHLLFARPNGFTTQLRPGVAALLEEEGGSPRQLQQSVQEVLEVIGRAGGVIKFSREETPRSSRASGTNKEWGADLLKEIRDRVPGIPWSDLDIQGVLRLDLANQGGTLRVIVTRYGWISSLLPHQAGLEEVTREEVGRVIQALQSKDPGRASQALSLLRNWLAIDPLPAAFLERGNPAMSALVDNAFHEDPNLNFRSKQLIGLFFESLEKNDSLFIPEAAALRALVNFLKYPDKASGLFVDFYARGLYTEVVFERAWTLSAMEGRQYDVKRRKEVEPPAAALVDFQIPIQTAQAIGFEWGSPLNQLYRARHIWDLLMLLETEREWPEGALTDEPGLSLRFLEALQTGTIQMWAQRDRGEEWERWNRLGEGFVSTTDILLLPKGFSPPSPDLDEPWAGLEEVRFYDGFTVQGTGEIAAGLEELVAEGLLREGQRRAVSVLPSVNNPGVGRLFIHANLPMRDFAGLEEIRLPADPRMVVALLREMGATGADAIILPISVAAGMEQVYRPAGSAAPIIVMPAGGLEEATLQELGFLARIARNLGGVFRVGLEEWAGRKISSLKNLMSISY